MNCISWKIIKTAQDDLEKANSFTNVLLSLEDDIHNEKSDFQTSYEVGSSDCMGENSTEQSEKLI